MVKSKSAYSVPTKKGKIDTHIFVVWVDNEAGVLARVVGLFSGRGYNIESLAVAEIDAKKNISRITIVTTGTPQVIDQIKLQLKKLVPVVTIVILEIFFFASISATAKDSIHGNGEAMARTSS
jgi:acetolactate synthase-1/3 small subunit